MFSRAACLKVDGAGTYGIEETLPSIAKDVVLDTIDFRLEVICRCSLAEHLPERCVCHHSFTVCFVKVLLDN